MATVVTKPYSHSCLQQLEQDNHMWAQTMAQPGWQCLQAAHYVLDQGGPTPQVDLSEINQETSVRNRPPNWGGGMTRREQARRVYLLLTKRGELLERSSEGIDIPPCTLTDLYCLWEGLPKGVLPGLHFDIFPPTMIEIQINS